MRILQLIMARQYRGAEISALELSRDLAAKGHDVLLVALYTYRTEKLNTHDIRVVDLSGEKQSAFSLKLLKSLHQTILEFKPDIVQANAGDTLKYASLVKRFFRVRFKLVFRNASTISRYMGGNLKRKLQYFFFSQVDAVISVSNVSAVDITGVFPFLKGHITVIPGGVREQNADVSGAADYEHLFSNAPVFIHVGGFTFEKNHIGLLRIFSQYLKRGNKGSLLLVGDGPLKMSVHEWAEKSELVGFVHFSGTRNDVAALLQRASALLLPSIIEGLPTVILEAFRARLPVIAYNVGGIAEVVKNGETGWLIGKGDEKGFVDAMVSVVKNSEEVNPIVHNAGLLVKRSYDQRVISKKFIETYNRLLKN
jgi:L-malate glycosyltransferase